MNLCPGSATGPHDAAGFPVFASRVGVASGRAGEAIAAAADVAAGEAVAGSLPGPPQPASKYPAPARNNIAFFMVFFWIATSSHAFRKTATLAIRP